MAATIKIKNSSTTGAVPTSSDLVQGELAVNVTDLGLYTENASGTVVKLNAPSIDDKNTGATKRMTIDTSGNLGLGVTPSAWSASYKALQVGATASIWSGASGELASLQSNAYFNGTNYVRLITGYATGYNQSGGEHSWKIAGTSTAGSNITFTTAMTLDASGNLGVGTTSPSYALDVRRSGSSPSIYVYRESASVDGGFLITNGNTNTVLDQAGAKGIVFNTNSTERARIDSSGNLLVGVTSSTANGGVSIVPGANPYVYTGGSSNSNTTSAYYLYSSTAGAYRFYVGYGGTISAVSTSITGLSDQRLKENIRDLDDGLEKVMALQPRKFDWKEGKGAGTKNARGFVAQEFETVFPDMIEQWIDEPPEGEEPYKAVNANLIPTLVKAIQEMKTIIDQQAERIAALEAK